MERWYMGFCTVGSPNEIIPRLIKAVREHQLGDFVTRFCYERGIGAKRSQYYLFVGVVSERRGVIPEEVYPDFYTMLQRLGLKDNEIYVYFDEIKSMVSTEIEGLNLRQVKMFKPTPLRQTDPFGYGPYGAEKSQTAETKPAFNQLLYWLSAYGHGTWQQFRATCTELGLDPTGEYARRIARRLRSLGHMEFIDAGQNWAIAPACLVQIETAEKQYTCFLAGQRSPKLIEMFQRDFPVEIIAHPYGNAPHLIQVSFWSAVEAEAFIEQSVRQGLNRVRLVGFAGLRIAGLLPDLRTWEESLLHLEIIKGNYTYQQWINGEFLPVHLPKETGLYQLTTISDRVNQPPLTLYYDAERDLWRKADWYGLRYLVLRKRNVPCEAYYDHDCRELYIPLDQRWPDLYERALVLSSGKLPVFKSDYAIYANVSENLAHMLVTKLDAQFIEHKGI